MNTEIIVLGVLNCLLIGWLANRIYKLTERARQEREEFLRIQQASNRAKARQAIEAALREATHEARGKQCRD